jgi:hypothetical protein
VTRSIAILALCSCAPLVYETRPVIESVTSNPALQQFAASIPVDFVAGSLREWCPDKFIGGQWQEAHGCVVDVAGLHPHIYVSTFDTGEGRWLYWSDIYEHELLHLFGWIRRDT